MAIVASVTAKCPACLEDVTVPIEAHGSGTLDPDGALIVTVTAKLPDHECGEPKPKRRPSGWKNRRLTSWEEPRLPELRPAGIRGSWRSSSTSTRRAG